MASVLDYILNNYIWFLIGEIILVLAIIGYYADKTNFGQGKKNISKKEKSISDIPNAKLQDLIQPEAVVKEQTIEQQAIEPVASSQEDSLSDEQNTIEPIASKQEQLEEKEQKAEETDKLEERVQQEQIAKLNEEFSKIVPKKSIISDDLIDDIDSISVDSVVSKSNNSIPDLDDVDLPKIKSLSSGNEDIWKF